LTAKKRWSYKVSVAGGICVLAAGVLAGLNHLVSGKPATAGSGGLVDDWTTHHVIFSTPGTAAQALARGRFEQWYKVVNDPRYLMQQAKRNPGSTGTAALSQTVADLFNRLTMPFTDTVLAAPPKKAPAAKRDWAFSLGAGKVAQNMYPAKYTFSPIGSPNCTTDYVAYGLNVAGTTGAGGQANMVALNELYSNSSKTGYCSSVTGPAAYWAYDASTNGGAVTTSPVLSLDGTKVIFVESVPGGSYLHVLIWNSSDGGGVTGSTVRKPTNSEPNVGSCSAGASCLVSIELMTTTGTSITSSSVTNSSPFYDYMNDIAYVGDDAGNLFKVTPVLGAGIPVVTGLSVAPGTRLTGTVYDSSSGYVFVGSTNGMLYAVTTSLALATHPSIQVGESGCGNAALIDSPIVDVSNGYVFATSMVGTDDTHTVVVQAFTTSSPNGTAGNANWPGGSSWSAAATADVGVGNNDCESGGTFYAHAPDFDNAYYTSPGTGHLLAGGADENTIIDYPALWSVAFSGSPAVLSAATEFTGAGSIPRTFSQNHAEISPLTEVYNGTIDSVFFGVGKSTTYGALFGFTVTDSSPYFTEISGSPYTSNIPDGQGGTSAIVIDNVANTANFPESSSIYFTTQGQATSSEKCNTSTSGYCAIKLTQTFGN
jgi:hypothetical protein